MTQPGPDPGRKSVLKMDLLDLPGLRQLSGGGGRMWENARNMGIANHAARREAKALLFAELAECARQGVPLDVAAKLAAGREVDCMLATGEEMTIKGISEVDILPVLLVASFVILPFISIPVYIILSARFANPQALAKSMADRLAMGLAKGLPMHAAMAQCRIDFTNEEIAVVRTAEERGDVPAALRVLAEHQIVSHSIQQQSGSLAYPLVLSCIGIGMTAFIHSYVLPRFVDVFRQLGMELPWLTQLSIGVVDVAAHRLLPLLAAVAIPLLAIHFLRGLLNGTLTGLVLAVPIIAGLLGIAGYSVASLAVEANPGWNLSLSQERLVRGAAAAIMAVVGIAGFPTVLRLLNIAVAWIEDALRAALAWVPGVGDTARAQSEAMWLAALSASLGGGVPAHEAVAAAGRACGGRALRRSQEAAALIEAGNPLGEACRKAAVLSAKTNHRLAFLDRSPRPIEELANISRDAAAASGETAERMARAAEVAGVVLCALAFAFFATCLYLPLFAIPGAVSGVAAR